jgi:hypothetical protein
MLTWVTWSRQSCGCTDSHAATSADVRPSTCPSRPTVPWASTIPVSHRSATTRHRPVTGSCSHFGLPRRVSSIPSTHTGGSGAARAVVVCAMNAACAVGHDIPE